MILGFKQKFPWGTQTYFREKILSSAGYVKFDMERFFAQKMQPTLFKPKTHTIRAGNRWKPGMKLHMAYGVRTKNYQQFNKGIPELEVVKGVQRIEIKWYTFHMKGLPIMGTKDSSTRVPKVIIDSTEYSGACSQVRQLATNDGFDSLEDFYRWFNKDFEGQIVHFTNYKY